MNIKGAVLSLLICCSGNMRVCAGWEELAILALTVAGCFFAERTFNADRPLLIGYGSPEKALLFKKQWMTELSEKKLYEPRTAIESMVDAYIELRALLEDTWCEALDGEKSSLYEQRCYGMLYKELRHRLEVMRLCIESSVSLLTSVERYCKNGMNVDYMQDDMQKERQAMRQMLVKGARYDVRFGTVCGGETAIDFARRHDNAFLIQLFDTHDVSKDLKCTSDKEVEK